MAYSLDFRKRVFSLKEKLGLTFKETSERFGVEIRHTLSLAETFRA